MSDGFINLSNLPNRLSSSQCIKLNDEILICGGENFRECYSYHTVRNEYRLFACYPDDVEIFGHCVIKFKDISSYSGCVLWSFGNGGDIKKQRHVLWMNYKSVWSDIENINKNDNNNNNNNNNDNNNNNNNSVVKSIAKVTNPPPENQWVPFNVNDDSKKEDNDMNTLPALFQKNYASDLRGARICKDGNDLFITYRPSYLSIINLEISTLIADHTILPMLQSVHLCYHAFLKLPNQYYHHHLNKLNNNNNKKITNNNNDEYIDFILVNFNNLVRIRYYKADQQFAYIVLPPPPGTISSCSGYAAIVIQDHVVLFGGRDVNVRCVVDWIHVYSIKFKTWKLLSIALPVPLFDAVAVLSPNGEFVHIIGGRQQNLVHSNTHFKIPCSLLTWADTEINTIIQYWKRMSNPRQYDWSKEMNWLVARFLKKKKKKIYNI